MTFFVYSETKITLFDVGQLGGIYKDIIKPSYNTKQDCEADLLKVLKTRGEDKLVVTKGLNDEGKIKDNQAMVITSFPKDKKTFLQTISCSFINFNELN